MNKFEYIVDKTQTLSNFLFGLGLKRGQIDKLFSKKDVRVDGVRRNQDCEIVKGQQVIFFLQTEIPKKYEIIYEDDNIYIVNKSAGIEVVGDEGLEGVLKGSVAVHRLDRNTKGLVILAKNKESADELLLAFKNKSVIKKYLCEVVGDTNFNNSICKAYLFKDAKKAQVYIYDEPKKFANEIKTIFTTVKHGKQTSIVECELVTGKTHQIRAHLAHLGHAIIGDGKYGKLEDNKRFGEKTQKLFCYYLLLRGMGERLKYLEGREFKLYPDWFNADKLMQKKI